MSLRSFSFFLLVTIFFCFSPIAISSPSSGWSAIPPIFQNIMKYKGIMINLALSKQEIGKVKAQINKRTIVIKGIKDLFLGKKILKENFLIYLNKKFSQGLQYNHIYSCIDTLLLKAKCKKNSIAYQINFNFKTNTLILYVSKQFYFIKRKVDYNYLPAPSVSTISGIVNYTTNFDYGNDNQNGQLDINTILSYKEDRIKSGSTFIDNNDTSDLYLHYLYYQEDFRNAQANIGYWQDTTSDSNIPYLIDTPRLVLNLHSYNRLYSNRKTESLNKIPIFFSQNSTVQIYRRNRLLSVQNFTVGLHEINTRILPSGIYPIVLKVKQNNQLIYTKQAMIYKPSIGNNLVNNSYSYNTSVGFLSSNLLYDKNSLSDFDMSYLSVLINKVFASRMLFGVGGIFIDNYQAFFVQNSIYFPFDFNLNITSGLDNDSGFAFNTQLNTHLGNIATAGIQYVRSNPGNFRLTPFNFPKNMIGLNLNLNFTKWHFGNFGINYYEYLDNNDKQFNIVHSIPLYRNRNFYLNLDSTYENDLYNTSNYSISLHFSYFFNTESIINSGASFQSQDDIKAIDISYLPEKIKHFSSAGMAINYNNYLTNLSSNISTVNQYFTSNLTLTNYQSQNNYGNSLSGYISGSIPFNALHFIPYHDFANSGLIINMDMPEKQYVRAIMSGGNEKLLHQCNNFIPLSEYSNNSFYIRQDKSNPTILDIKDKLKHKITLYPGNIAYVSNMALPKLEILGQILDKNGQPLKNLEVVNDTTTASTDKNGLLDIMIDKNNPKLVLYSHERKVIKIFSIPKKYLTDNRPGDWIGKIIV